MSGIATDRHDRIWIVHRPASLARREPGAGYQWPESEHGIYVDANDSSGSLETARLDRANRRVVVFDSERISQVDGLVYVCDRNNTGCRSS